MKKNSVGVLVLVRTFCLKHFYLLFLPYIVGTFCIFSKICNDCKKRFEFSKNSEKEFLVNT